MGYSLSQEQYEKLERNRQEGRLCSVSTGRGGCFSRATVRWTTNSWMYAEDRQAGKAPEVTTSVVCTRHNRDDWHHGTNYEVISTDKF